MYLTHKCWDVSVCYMHAGQGLKIKCPSYYAYGGERRYGHFDNVIPEDSTLTFELDVLECAGSVKEINAKNRKAKNNAAKVVTLKKDGSINEHVEAKEAKKKIVEAKQEVDKLEKKHVVHKK